MKCYCPKLTLEIEKALYLNYSVEWIQRKEEHIKWKDQNRGWVKCFKINDTISSNNNLQCLKREGKKKKRNQQIQKDLGKYQPITMHRHHSDSDSNFKKVDN